MAIDFRNGRTVLVTWPHTALTKSINGTHGAHELALGLSPCVERARPRTRAAGERALRAAIAGESSERRYKRRHATRRHEHRGARGDLARGRDVARDDRQTVSKCLRHGHAVALARRRKREQRRLLVLPRERAS